MRKRQGAVLLLLVIFFSCDGQVNQQEKKIKREHKPIQQISQVVRMMFQDSKGDFWFGTENGAFKLTGDSLKLFDGIRSETGKGVTIKDIVEDGEGVIWIGHTDGISCIRGDSITNYYESSGLRSNDVWCIESDSKGNIWIGTFEGACFFDGEEFQNFVLPEGDIDPTLGISSTTMIHSIFEDSKGVLWFATNAGLFSYSNDELTDVSAKVGIETKFVNEVFEDREGRIWVSAKDGLYLLHADSSLKITWEINEIGKGIGSVAQDGEGKIWFVLNQHYLYAYDGKDLKEFQKTEENKGPVIFQIYQDQDERLWFVGFGGAFRMENGNFVNITMDGPW